MCESSRWGAALQQRLQDHAIQAYAYLHTQLADFPHPSQFTLVLTDDTSICTLNADWRDKDQPTNVLAFPAAPLPASFRHVTQTLGEVIIAFETAAREAQALHLDITEHTTHLIIHGLLHLLGHDHLNNSERHIMELWETLTLAEFSYHNPYELESHE
ncbi:MAG: rRNA maturation RNase YbeY [Alphaproteobacteria bacterium]|nr:rRNA maturation RNase YbeY [Alphaproteobacteria bacterium]